MEIHKQAPPKPSPDIEVHKDWVPLPIICCRLGSALLLGLGLAFIFASLI